MHDKQMLCVALVQLLCCVLGQLVVNVKNKGDEVLRERIQANTTLDTITLDFQELDGTLVTQLIDLKNVNILICIHNSYLIYTGMFPGGTQL